MLNPILNADFFLVNLKAEYCHSTALAAAGIHIDSGVFVGLLISIGNCRWLYSAEKNNFSTQILVDFIFMFPELDKHRTLI